VRSLCKTGTRRIRSRAALIGATVLLQAAVIGLGWGAWLHLARADVSARARERYMEEVTRGIDQFEAELSKVALEPVRYDEKGWAEVQTLVEGFKMPRGASLVLLDRFGRILCHPGLRNNPNLRSIDYSDVLITLQPTGERLAVGSIKPGSTLTGEAELLSGTSTLAVAYNPTAEVRIVADLSAGGMASLESRLTGGFMLWGAAAGVVILGVTLLGSVMLVRRYDSVLARANEELESEVDRRTRRGLAILHGLVFGLAKLADHRDTDTGRHLERICRYCEILGEELLGRHPEVDRAWIDRLKFASSMHDIGKVGIPDAILLKVGPLTPDERRLMELHPIIGADTLVAIRQRVGDDDLINMGIQVTLSHHERYDGTGYPYRLHGEQIPLAARIVALADVYDALTSARVYKRALRHQEAVERIRASRGTHLDPLVVDAFLDARARFDEARVQLHTSSEADIRRLLTGTLEASPIAPTSLAA
jgi:HD-GYP domain-containing protein (c-di-GMP phosphodiesterase class II)